MNDDKEIKDIITKYFNSKNCDVIEIPVSKIETPDLLVTIEELKVIIEIKSKLPSVKQSDKTISIERIERKAKYLKAAQKSSKQMNSFSKDEVKYKILWLDCGNIDPELHFHNYRYTLFGIKLCQPLNSSKIKEGFYITHSDFYKYRDKIDGAIISCTNEIFFYVNNYSNNYEEIKEGKLKKALPQPFDVIEEDKKGSIYLADFDVDRDNELDIQKALSKKYGFEAMFLITPNSIIEKI